MLSYGAWVTFHNQADVKTAKDLMKACYDAGVNFFDNAEVYAGGMAETIMGQSIKELGWKRSDLVVSTKIFWGGPGPNDRGLSRKHIIEGTKVRWKCEPPGSQKGGGVRLGVGSQRGAVD